MNWQFPNRLLFAFEHFPEIDLALRDPEEARKLFEAPFAQHGISLTADTTIIQSIDRWVIRGKDAGYVVILKEDKVEVYEGFSAVQISAEILKEIKTMVERELGQPVNEAVITCPAYFNSNEAENTRKAGELAGFKVNEIIREPVAAAVCHGVDRLEEGKRIMVCDLGGGTFDTTILQMMDGQFDPIATVGNRLLGGHDWTSELVDLVAERVVAEAQEDPKNDPASEGMLYEACEKAKRNFNKGEEEMIPCTVKGQLIDIKITRKDFEERTEYLVAKMLTTCENCLKKAGLEWREIDNVLMVGGSSRMLRIGQALQDAWGKKPELARAPDTMVVNGAAIMARGGIRTRKHAGGLSVGRSGGITTVNPKRRTARALGTRAYDRQRNCVVSVLVMPHGLEAPANRSCEDLEVSTDGQKFFDIPVMEYEDKMFDENDHQEPVGNYRFFCLEIAKRGDRIKVTLGYDKSQISYAEASDIKTGKILQVDKVAYKEPDLSQITILVKPRWVVFALDVSGSMDTDDKIGDAKKVLVESTRELLAGAGGQCRVGIVTFSESVNTICSPTSDFDEIERCVSSIKTASTTAMHKGIREAVHLAMLAPAGTDREVVLVTDGMPDPDTKDDTRSAAMFANSNGVKLSMLGIGKGDVDKNYPHGTNPKCAGCGTAWVERWSQHIAFARRSIK